MMSLFLSAHGETKALFGVAGSGKSSILKLAMGLIRPDAGRIQVLGHDITEMSEDELLDLAGPHRNDLSGKRAVRFADCAR